MEYIIKKFQKDLSFISFLFFGGDKIVIIQKEEIIYNKMEYIITAEFLYENYNNPNIMKLFTEVVY